MMADREKVIKGFERCMTDMNKSDSMPCRSCPYGTLPKKENCQKQMFADVYALLKEQDAVEPIAMQRMDGNFSFFVPYFLCGNCRYELVGKDVMFCHHCGKPVNWK